MKMEELMKRQYRIYMVRGIQWLVTAQMLKRAADKILADQQIAQRCHNSLSDMAASKGGLSIPMELIGLRLRTQLVELGLQT